MIAADVSLMIFAAGFGTRMKDLTRNTPKPMLYLRGEPMINHSLKIAENAGLGTVFANTHHLHTVIAPHLESRGVEVLHETPDILDTGAGLKAARSRLTSPTLTLNPDCDWAGPNPLTHLLDNWQDTMQALLLLVPVERAQNRSARGDFCLSGTSLKRGGDMIYTGAQLIRTERLDAISDRAFSLNVYWDHLAATNDLHGTIYPGQWADIGTKQALIKANAARDV